MTYEETIAEIHRLIDMIPDHIANRLLDVWTLYLSLDAEQRAIFDTVVFPLLDLNREPLEVARV